MEIRIKLMKGETYQIKANKIPKITGDLEVQPVDLKGVDLKDFQLVDTSPTEPGFLTVDLLIGYDYYDDLITPEKKKSDTRPVSPRVATRMASVGKNCDK